MKENGHRHFSPARLKTAREHSARGRLSYERVAGFLGRNHQTIRNWESGVSEPNASDLAGLAVVTGKPLDYFFEKGA